MKLKKTLTNIARELTKENLSSKEVKMAKTCDLFNIETVGMHYYDSIIKKGEEHTHPSPKNTSLISKYNPIKFKLSYMSKDEYGKIIKNSLTDASVSNQKISKIMVNMQNGIKYDTPMIDLSDRYSFQEGRHRVIAAHNLGCDSIPIFIFGTDRELQIT